MKVNKLGEHISIGVDKHNLKIYDIYSPVVPFSIRKTYKCPCSNNMSVCPHFESLIDPKKTAQMKIKYQQLWKTNIGSKTNLAAENTLPNSTLVPDLLEPHLQHLLALIDIPDRQMLVSLTSILNHAKSQHLTFWLFAQVLSHMPTAQKISEDLHNMIREYALDLRNSLPNKDIDELVRKVVSSNASNLIPVQIYPRFVVQQLQSKGKKYLSRLVFIYLLTEYSIHPKDFVHRLNSSNKELLDWESIFQATKAFQNSLASTTAN